MEALLTPCWVPTFVTAIEIEMAKSPCARDRCHRAVVEMGQPTNYAGPIVSHPHICLRRDEALELYQWVSGEGHDLPTQYLYAVVINAIDRLRSMNNVESLVLEGDAIVDVVSGLNGDIDAVHAAFAGGCKVAEFVRHVVFLGDYIGPMHETQSLKTLISVLLMMIAIPTNVHMLRGDHETLEVAQNSAFRGQVMDKYSVEAFALIKELFDALPLAYVVNDSVLLVHAGVPRSGSEKIAKLNAINRFTPTSSFELDDLLWSDPHNGSGVRSRKAGHGIYEGSDVIQQFLETNCLDMVVRAGHVEPQGYQEYFGGKLLSLASYGTATASQGTQTAIARIGRKSGYKKLHVAPVHFQIVKASSSKKTV
eukprot:m51a1_g6616 putative serine threonine protein (366) ;mRNA; r:34111-35311